MADSRVVVNPKQASHLLDAVGAQGRTGRHLVAFFGAMYYSALRPGEAADLRRTSLELPDEDGWGQLILSRSAPTTGASWSDSGDRRDDRQLKHRATGDVRVVPCPPQLVHLFRAHLAEFGTDSEGRLFRGARGGQLSESVYSRAWQKAREIALSTAQVVSPLAGRPYDLRHAAVSTWLSSGVEATRVAEWAGHSVAVLLRVYTKCIDGQEEAARKRVETALHVD
ncbi:MAG: tyrosine-type recombinase/integrase [Actinobacteria bacterium]|nr:tyrosine-type recombinase/integrase [Actinomycetota bacterium]